ncbi:MAG: SDR family NAD(P)-dependent oxidoreductase [Novosphingobium sp.]|nr:SDR family NAD(P)-dependent oxidoreductase [Novosphingobium sp.]
MASVNFEGRVAIVTGAGGGIGREHALELARRGASVVVNDLGGDVAGRNGSVEMAKSVVQEIRDAGGTAVANGDSVAETEGANAMVAQAIDSFGKLDILINSAGNWRAFPIEETSDEDWDAVVGTHLTGSFKMTRAAWPHMKAQGYGRIVYTCSSAGMFGMPWVGGYGAAKAGVAGLMNIAALEGAEHGIFCNAIMPNGNSRMAMQAGADWAERSGILEMDAFPDIGNSMNVEFNMPIAVWLASEACTSSQALYSQCLGRVARVFFGVVPGWQHHRQSAPAVEDIAAHWDEICDTTQGFVTPGTATEELHVVLAADGNTG